MRVFPGVMLLSRCSLRTETGRNWMRGCFRQECQCPCLVLEGPRAVGGLWKPLADSPVPRANTFQLFSKLPESTLELQCDEVFVVAGHSRPES